MVPFSYGGLFVPASTEADGNIKSLFIFQIQGVYPRLTTRLNLNKLYLN